MKFRSISSRQSLVFGMALSIALLFGMLQLPRWLTKSRSHLWQSPSATNPQAMGSDAVSHKSGKIPHRSTDSAARVLLWYSPNKDAHTMRAQLAEAKHLVELISQNQEIYDQYESFDVWDQSFANANDDDEFGHQIADCITTFESKLQTRCSWSLRVVVHNEGPDRSSIAALASEFDTNLTRLSAACRDYARCVQNAWSTRESPVISDPNRPYLSIKTLGTPITAAALGIPNEDRINWYAQVLAESRADVDSTHQALKSHSTPSSIHNHKFETALLRHLEAVIDMLNLEDKNHHYAELD